MNLMLKLKNIQITDDYIQAHYNPEDSTQMGFVKLNLHTKEKISNPVPTFENTYPEMAFSGLQKVLDETKKNQNYIIPKEKLVMWY